MPNWLRALIAGLVARKLGCGCLSTILIFVFIYYALGQCNHSAVRHGYLPSVSPVQTALIHHGKAKLYPWHTIVKNERNY